MKKTITVIFVLLLLILSMNISAIADDSDYFTFSYYSDTTSVPESGGNIELTIKINHASNSAYVMSNAGIYSGETKVMNLGNIYAGQELSKTGSIYVNSDNIPIMNLTLRWKENNATSKEKPFTLEFKATANTEADIKFTRTISQTSGESQSNITMTYKVENVGSVKVSDIIISDTIAGNVKTLSQLKSGQYTTSKYTRKVENGFTTSPKLSYMVNGTKYEKSIDSVDILLSEPKLSLSVVSNMMTISPSSTIIISFTLKNTGNSSLDNIHIFEDNLGKIIDVASLAAGETKILTYETTPTTSQSFNFTAAGDTGGEEEWVDTATLDIVVDAALAQLAATIDIKASVIQLVYPGIVNFDITITNTGSEILKNLKIYDKDNELIQEIAQLVTGKNTFQHMIEAKETDTYYFTLEIESNNIDHKINSTPIEIKVVNTTSDNTNENTANVTASPTEGAKMANIIDENPKSKLALEQIALIIGAIVVFIVILIFALTLRIKKTRK